MLVVRSDSWRLDFTETYCGAFFKDFSSEFSGKKSLVSKFSIFVSWGTAVTEDAGSRFSLFPIPWFCLNESSVMHCIGTDSGSFGHRMLLFFNFRLFLEEVLLLFAK